MHESVRSDCLSGPQDTEQVPAGTDSLSQSLQDPAQKQKEIHNGGVAALKHQLEGGEDISFQIRDNLPGLLYTVNGKENWTAVRVLKPRVWMDSEATASGFDDSEDEYNVNYLQHCKKIRFFSKDGDPAVSVYSGHCRFPTPIACRTRAKLNL